MAFITHKSLALGTALRSPREHRLNQDALHQRVASTSPRDLRVTRARRSICVSRAARPPRASLVTPGLRGRIHAPLGSTRVQLGLGTL